MGLHGKEGDFRRLHHGAMIQAILTGTKRRDDVVAALAKQARASLVKQWDGVSLPIIMGNLCGCDDIQIVCRVQGKPYVYIDHGYFTRGYDRGVFRICVSNHHCTDWRDSERKRWKKLKPWHTGKHVIVIHPAEYVAKIYGKQRWLDETVETLKKHTDRRIIVKPKGTMDLQALCEDAHALVSFGSVADVEAAMMGVPVFCSPHSPASPIGLGDFTKIESPIYPEREPWLRSLSAAEWGKNEFDQAWKRVSEVLTEQHGVILSP